jgi:hypothetical protein
MRKDITICFRTDKAIRNSLELIANKDRQTISFVIETILFNHLKEKKALDRIGQEKRKYNRKQVSLPAFIMDSGPATKDFKTGKVMDISLGGIRLSVPRGVDMTVSTDNETKEFHIIFTMPDAMQPINFKCKSKRVVECGGDLHVGATFVDSDFQSYQALQKHLM